MISPVQIFAVGGGGFTHPEDNYPHDAILEDHLLALAGPIAEVSIGYIGHASNDDPAKIEMFYKRFDRCAKITTLPLEASLTEARGFLDDLDILYVGGGATKKMLAHWQKIGIYKTISNRDAFDMEYWSLEQAKLKKGITKRFDGKVVVITGGCGAIGFSTASEFRKEGAEVVILDVNSSEIENSASKLNISGISCNVTSLNSIKSAFKQIIHQYGGVDIVISNAGAAWTGKIAEVTEKDLRNSFELNFFAHQFVAKTAVKIMIEQKFGGCILFNTSKQAINPGDSFGPYGLPKAATLFLSRQYALEYGKYNIRSNAVNADRIRSGILNENFIKKRASSRGVSENEYMQGNLLQKEVLAKNVAKAFMDLADSEVTTGAVLTVDGGNISAALR